MPYPYTSPGNMSGTLMRVWVFLNGSPAERDGLSGVESWYLLFDRKSPSSSPKYAMSPLISSHSFRITLRQSLSIPGSKSSKVRHPNPIRHAS